MNLPTGVLGILFWIFIAFFFLVSALNLVSGFFELEKLRRFSKPFCLFFLTLAAAVAVPTHPLVYIGSFCGFVGDFLLLWKNNKKTLLGGLLAFLIGHCCYIAQMIMIPAAAGLFTGASYGYMALYFVLLLGLLIDPIYHLTRRSKIFTIGGTFYSAVLVTDGAAAILLTALGYAQFMYLAIVGDILFISSDLILANTIFNHDFPRRDFYIMLTYLAGQAFIVAALVFTLLR